MITPAPYEGESFLGFVLRTSDLNRYDTPGHILRYAGMNENEARSVRLPVDKLAKLYGCNSHELEQFAYTNTEGSRYGKKFTILGHSLYAQDLSIKKSKICAKCILESGYIDAYWDLRYAVVCPHHGEIPLTSCPSCGCRLSFSRPRMLQCRCGYNLSKSSAGILGADETVALSELLYRKLHGQPLASERLQQAKFPLAELEKVEFRTVLGLINRFGRVAQKAEGKANISDTTAVILTANALADWPQGLYSFLDQAGDSAKFTAEEKHASFTSQFKVFNHAFFKSGLPSDEIEFIRNAFIEYGGNHWKRGILDKRVLINPDDTHRNIVGIDELAGKIGVRPVTVKQMVKAGLIKPVVTHSGNRERMLFDLTNGYPTRKSEGKSISDREAGKYVGIPVSVLANLRKTGTFRVRYLGTKVSSYHEYDLDAFKTSLIEISGDCVFSDFDQSEYMTLTDAMRAKAGGPESKARVISAILSNELTTHGRVGNEVGDIILERKAVKSVIQEMKSHIMQGRLASEVAEYLGCDIEVISWLVENEYLDQTKSGVHLRVTEKTLAGFSGRYVFLINIAKALSTTTRGIMHRCDNMGISLLYAQRASGKSSQPFMAIEDAAKFDISISTADFRVNQ
ncbi:TniQ family protein [Thiohalobacter thiocyanaticus]|nr:TniQ family protein [Thiohalobacter thiocyanaticus]